MISPITGKLHGKGTFILKFGSRSADLEMKIANFKNSYFVGTSIEYFLNNVNETRPGDKGVINTEMEKYKLVYDYSGKTTLLNDYYRFESNNYTRDRDRIQSLDLDLAR